jgi:ferric-dicitrate binding protein FerR (iron transport regulator)
MTQSADDMEVDELLRSAMRARPQPAPASNLVHRAVELARAHAAAEAKQRLQMLSRLRRRNTLVGLAASILIAMVVLIGAQRVYKTGLLNDSSTTTSTSSDSTSSTTSSIAVPLGVAVTAEALVVALILLSAGPPDPRPTFA